MKGELASRIRTFLNHAGQSFSEMKVYKGRDACNIPYIQNTVPVPEISQETRVKFKQAVVRS